MHLPIITELASMCHRVFAGGSIQYAYTTIPTYPRYRVRHAPHEIPHATALIPDDDARGRDRASTPYTCSGQIGFMICSKKSAEEPLDTRVPRQPAPVCEDFPALRQVPAQLNMQRVRWILRYIDDGAPSAHCSQSLLSVYMQVLQYRASRRFLCASGFCQGGTLKQPNIYVDSDSLT